MAFKFSKIVAGLVQPIGFCRKLERGEDGGGNLFGTPTTDGIAAVQENLQQPDDPRVVDFDTGIATGTSCCWRNPPGSTLAGGSAFAKRCRNFPAWARRTPPC